MEALVILALSLCPWQPDPLPELILMPSDGFDLVLETLSKKKYRGASHTAHGDIRGIYDAATNTVILDASHANDRVLCHEYRHAADPEWKHE